MKFATVLLVFVGFQLCFVGADDFVCPGSGRFPDKTSPNCKSFYLCEDKFGILVSSKRTCGGALVFSWDSRSCVSATEYKCPNIIDFQCPGIGKYPDKTSPDCKTYFDCDDQNVPARRECTEPSIFSWDLNVCVQPSDYQCPNMETEFNCQTLGRFPNDKSPDCRTFFECDKNCDGKLFSVIKTCLETTVFSKETHRCVYRGAYKCPGVLEDCSAPGKFADPTANDCKTYRHCILAGREYVSYIFQCPPGLVFNPTQGACVSDYTCT